MTWKWRKRLFQVNYHQKKGGTDQIDPKTKIKIKHGENHNITEKVQPTRKTMFSLHVSNQIVSKYIKRKTVRTTGSLLEGNSGRLHLSHVGQTTEN